MILKDKVVAIFAATGAIGSAVARRMRSEGARLHLSGRSGPALAALAAELQATYDLVDALDEAEIERHLDEVVARSGRLDVVFDPIGPRPDELGYGRPIAELSEQAFARTLATVAGSQFLVARAAARHMTAQGAGSIVTLSASLTGDFVPLMTGISAACGAVEAMTRSLAGELGPHGVRVNCVRAGGMRDTRTIQETMQAIARTTGVSLDAQPMGGLLRRPLTPADVAALVAFVASDLASGVTGQILNVCGGTVVSH